MKTLVLDCETHIPNRGDGSIGTFGGNPFHKDAGIVWAGVYEVEFDEYVVVPKHLVGDYRWFDADLLVGQNIKFDILQLIVHNREQYHQFEDFIARGGKIWDTQLAEYVLSGQTWVTPHLGDKKDGDGKVLVQGLATKYGGHDKDSRMKEYWDAGIDTADIPEEEILPYLYGDVTNTLKVYQGQLKASEGPIRNVLESDMDALLCTIEMEYNGMQFDKFKCVAAIDDLQEELDEVVMDISLLIFSECGGDLDKHEKLNAINANSAAHISAALFGGVFTTSLSRPNLDEEGNEVIYKSGIKKGQIRTKKTPVALICKGTIPEDIMCGAGVEETKRKGVYKTDDKTLNKLLNHAISDYASKLITRVITNRGLVKDIGTYYVGYSDNVWQDGKIHASINHAITVTGRLSCSGPNLQNCPH